MPLKLGELFAGFGGLGMAVEEVFEAELTWYAEWDDAPSKIMAHHWPGVPNHRDVTTVDWSQVEPVDIISGGSPCQDLSAAGRRAGMTEGTRSNLWVSMREAIATIKPTYVVWENVRGAYSATATSEMEHCPGCMGAGGGARKHVLRALGRVLGDLSDLGYDCQWRGLRAADVGAPHGRYRVFILATRRGAVTDTDGIGSGRRDDAPRPLQSREQDLAPRFANGGTRKPGAAPTDSGGPAEWEHPGGSSEEETGEESGHGSVDLSGEQPSRNRREVTANAEVWRRRVCDGDDERAPGGEINAPRHDSDASSGAPGTPTDWGVYAPAIRRWEAVRGTAPAPTELTTKGKHRLNAAFAEWMMGLEPGHVTDVPGLTRNEQLKAIGNGVVPQQAVAALREMRATA